MTDTHIATAAYEPAGVQPGSDPVTRGLWIAIAVVGVLLVTGIAFALVSGWLTPSGPRTALEARAITAADSVRKVPASGQYRYDLIVTLGLSGQDRQARQQVDLAKQQLKGIQLPYAYLGEATLDLNGSRFRDAVKAADAGLKAQADAWTVEKKRLAKLAIQMNEPESMQPVQIQLDLVKAQALVKLGDWKGSAEALTAALTLAPRSADVLVLRAVTYRQMGDLDKARADYKTALEFVPDYQPAIDGLKQIGGQ